MRRIPMLTFFAVHRNCYAVGNKVIGNIFIAAFLAGCAVVD
jgi:hypothetical protein